MCLAEEMVTGMICSEKGTVAKGALLVAGTAIGGGMLAMPLLTGLGGFVPSLLIFFLCWLFMAATGLLIMEVTLWMGGDSNFITMAEKTIGPVGRIVTWIFYLFFFYTLTLAYVVGCGEITWLLLSETVPLWAGSILFLCVFGPMVYAGARLIGIVNVPLMAGLLLTYFGFVALGYTYVNPELLQHADWGQSFRVLPVAFTAFGYQGTVPTLTRYLGRDKKRVTKAILLGTFVALMTYIIWHWLILGIVPVNGPGSLMEALEKGNTAIHPLQYAIADERLFRMSQFFAFFALLTSFLGVSLGLRDFLADGLKIEKTAKGRLFLCLLIFVPILSVAILYPSIFTEALSYAGGFGSAFLLGVLPIAMVWWGRYHRGFPDLKVIPGGRATLIVMSLFVFTEITLEVLHIVGVY